MATAKFHVNFGEIVKKNTENLENAKGALKIQKTSWTIPKNITQRIPKIVEKISKSSRKNHELFKYAHNEKKTILSLSADLSNIIV